VKLAAIAILLSASIYGQPLQFHSVMTDAFVDITSAPAPSIPGSPPGALYRIGVSLVTRDTNASAYAVYLAMSTSDGSTLVQRRTVAASCDWLVPTYLEFRLPPGTVPVKILSFTATRLHAEVADVFGSQLDRP
jgi:hypothetical protein